MTARLEPSELDLRDCAACGRTFTDGDPYFRGMHVGPVGVGLFILCIPCAAEIQHNPEGGRAEELTRYLSEASLDAAPAGGRA